MKTSAPEHADAFRNAILPHLDGAYNLARYVTRDAVLSEDVVQDAVLRAYRAFGQFRGSSPRAWLFAIVRNCSRTAMSGRSGTVSLVVNESALSEEAAQQLSDHADPSPSPEEELSRKQDSERVRSAIEGIPEPFREAIVLRDLEGLSYAEIAEVTGAPVGTVMSRLSRGRAMLAKELLPARNDEGEQSRSAKLMAACVDQELLLAGLVDGELDAANTALIEAHVARCDGCREELDRIQAVRALLAGEGVRHSAPEALMRRITALHELSPEGRPRRLPGWLAPGLAGALAASLLTVTLLPAGSQAVVDQEIVSDHVRSLQPGHLTDVQTTNQHIVKPWFNGRISFSPPVPELADAGFPLAGGRLDSLDGKTVAAIVYHRRLHTVNLFVWPEPDQRDRTFTKDGFTVREWSRNGLRFAAVSDIPAAELAQFQALFVQRSG